MADEKNVQGTPMGYGYEDDTVKQSTFHFGGNFGTCKLTKFEWTDKGGKKDESGNPTAGEALDIVFNIGGTEKSYRMFPVTKAFDENQVEVTDPTHPAFLAAAKNFNQICTQILKCFVDENDVKAGLSKRIASFKDFCAVLMGMLPKDYATKPLDIFLQYQWKIGGENNRTFLEIPKNIKQGKFLCAAVVPTSGAWTEIRNDKEMFYVDATEAQIKENPVLVSSAPRHPFFSRTEWFVNSNFATQQSEGGETTPNTSSASGTGGAANAASGGW
jgi:hypothetical protein